VQLDGSRQAEAEGVLGHDLIAHAQEGRPRAPACLSLSVHRKSEQIAATRTSTDYPEVQCRLC
jgi:hypothetical protein